MRQDARDVYIGEDHRSRLIRGARRDDPHVASTAFADRADPPISGHGHRRRAADNRGGLRRLGLVPIARLRLATGHVQGPETHASARREGRAAEAGSTGRAMAHVGRPAREFHQHRNRPRRQLARRRPAAALDAEARRRLLRHLTGERHPLHRLPPPHRRRRDRARRRLGQNTLGDDVSRALPQRRRRQHRARPLRHAAGGRRPHRDGERHRADPLPRQEDRPRRLAARSLQGVRRHAARLRLLLSRPAVQRHADRPGRRAGRPDVEDHRRDRQRRNRFQAAGWRDRVAEPLVRQRPLVADADHRRRPAAGGRAPGAGSDRIQPRRRRRALAASASNLGTGWPSARRSGAPATSCSCRPPTAAAVERWS